MAFHQPLSIIYVSSWSIIITRGDMKHAGASGEMAAKVEGKALAKEDEADTGTTTVAADDTNASNEEPKAAEAPEKGDQGTDASTKEDEGVGRCTRSHLYYGREGIGLPDSINDKHAETSINDEDDKKIPGKLLLRTRLYKK